MMVTGMEEVDSETPPLPHPLHLTAKNLSLPLLLQGRATGRAQLACTLIKLLLHALGQSARKPEKGPPTQAATFFPRKVSESSLCLQVSGLSYLKRSLALQGLSLLSFLVTRRRSHRQE